MSPLKLDTMLPDDEYIEVGDQKFYITARISRDLIFSFLDIKEELEGEMTREKILKVDDLLIDLIASHPKNDREAVRKFVKSLGLVEFNRMATFITDYIRAVLADNKKKADSNPSSEPAPQPTGQ